MSSAERLAAAATVALLAVAAGAPVAQGEVVRVTTVRATTDDRPDAVSVAAFPADAAALRVAGVPAAGLPGDVDVLQLGPPGAGLAYAGSTAVGAIDPDSDELPPERPEAGVLALGSGVARPFTAPGGGPLGAPGRARHGSTSDGAPPWISWSPDGGSVVLHGAGRLASDPWLARPQARRCDVATAACRAPVRHDVVDLPGGGTVRIDAQLSAEAGTARYLGDEGGRALARRLKTASGRRYALRVRVQGRATGGSWTATGALRGGAPAYDRVWPSAAGVLVDTSTVRTPRAQDDDDGELVLSAEPGPAVVVRADGTVRRLGALPYDVVGTLPDGRWVLTGRDPKQPFAAVSGQPLRTLDAEGRIAPLTSGGRPISPIWAAGTAGLPDTVSRDAEVARAGVDTTSGLLVLVLGDEDGDFGGAEPVVTLPLDGSAPPRLLSTPDGPGVAEHLVR